MSFNEPKKELAFIGLGRMGAAMSAHLSEQDFVVHGFDVSENIREKNKESGITVHRTLEETINTLNTENKIIWLMVPARFVDDVIDKLLPLLSRDDIIIDGGNSFFKDTLRRHQNLESVGVEYVDCGTSGGVDGARHGASLMIGSDKKIFKKLEHIFKALAIKNGYGHVGETGAGHFVKMIHNGIEYGMMGAIAEGVNILTEHKDGLGIEISEALRPFENGSIIASNLMSWLADAYEKEGYLENIAGQVPVGETEMEMEYLIGTEKVRVLAAAVTQRKLTRVEPSFTGTLISAMRNQFGAHKVVTKSEKKDEDKHN